MAKRKRLQSVHVCPNEEVSPHWNIYFETVWHQVIAGVSFVAQLHSLNKIKVFLLLEASIFNLDILSLGAFTNL